MPAGPATGLSLQTRTRLQSVQEISSWIGASDDPRLNASAGVELDSAIRRLNAYKWTFCRRMQEITLLDQERNYPLDSIFRSHLGALLSDDQGRPACIFPFKTYQDYLKDYPMAEATTETGTPSLYTVRSPESDNVIRVAPMPITGNGAGNKIFLHYHTIIAFARDPGEALVVPQSVDELIKWMALETFIPKQGSDRGKSDTVTTILKGNGMDRPGLWNQVMFEFQDHGEIELIPWMTPV